jgi:type VI secretion system secreted protein Hcp
MSSNIYLKIAPVDKLKSDSDFFQGNSQDINHINQIEVEGWSHSFEQPITAATKSSDLGPASRCNHEAITFSKYFDNATDELIKSCWIGKCLDASFYLYRPLEGGPSQLTDKPNRYLQIALSHCYISSMSISGESDDIAKEEISLVYNYVQYSFMQADLKKGKLHTTPKAIDWSWTSNVITSAPLNNGDFG